MGSKWKFIYINYNFLTYFYFLKVCPSSRLNKDLYMKDRSLVIQYCYLFKFFNIKVSSNLIKNLTTVSNDFFLNISWDLMSNFKDLSLSVDSFFDTKGFDSFKNKHKKEFNKDLIKFLFFRLSGLLEDAKLADNVVDFTETSEGGEIAKRRLLGDLFVYSGKKFRKIPLSVYSVGYKLGDFILTKKPSFFRTKKKKGARYLKR